MASLQVRLQDIATRIATESKSHKILINGNATDLAALTTLAKTNLVAALNEVAASVAGKQNTLGFTPENVANKGLANGYAGLDGTGKVPAAQLPAFVDDVLEATTFAALPATGSAGILYVTLNNNQVYRWSGSAYIQITASPGSTDAVAEGAINLYFTAARAIAALNPSLGNTDTDLVAVFNSGLI